MISQKFKTATSAHTQMHTSYSFYCVYVWPSMQGINQVAMVTCLHTKQPQGWYTYMYTKYGNVNL